MSRWLPALLLTAALALPAPAQTQDPPKPETTKPETVKPETAKAAIPPNTFFRGQTPSQYLASERLIGAKVTNKDGQTIGTISDLIIGSGDKIDGVILSVGGVLGVGDKKIGVRLSALKLARADSKLPVSLPNASKEILDAVPAYEKAGTVLKK
jgi:PRC-barrel domain